MQIHIEDLQMPEGVAAIYETNFALVTVVTPSVEETPTTTVVPAEGVAEPAATEAPKESES